MKATTNCTRLVLLAGALFSLLGCSAVQSSGKADSESKKPNIILIMVDDMGWSDIGCYGGEILTPNLDRLAREGMRFSQFYNNAKCTTTRASLVTGLYPRRDKKDKELLRTNMVTLGEVMQTAGYQTVLSGKWHLGHENTHHPVRRGFQEFYGLLDGCCNFFDPAQRDPEYKGSRIRYFAHNETRITEFPEDYYTTDAFTDHAIANIKKHAQNNQPFFLHLTYTAPHYPLHALPEDIAKYKGKYMDGWEILRKKRYQRQLQMGLIDSASYKLSGFDSRAYPWEDADHEFEDLRMAVYAAMIDRVDQNIGRLMQSLKDNGVSDNTLVMFLSDNGGCAEEPGGRNPMERNPGPKEDYVAVGPAWGWAQNTPFRRYKVWMHEGGIRTPFIAWWPGKIPADTLTHEVGHIIDILPTFLDLSKESYPDKFNGYDILPTEGLSLLPVLEGQSRTGHKQLCWEYNGNRAVRQGNWKLCWDKLVRKWELYDLSKDQSEMNNLADKYPDKAAKMKQDWVEWAAKTGLIKS